MVALLRLKATFEAWKSNFRGLSWTFWPKYENMGSRLGKEWHVETAPPCEEHRATSKDVRATVHEKQHGTAENARARTTSVSVSCACRLRIWSWSGKKRFSGSDGGLSRGVWTGPLTGFSTSSTLTLWILSEHSKPQPASCALPLLLYLTQHLHPFTGRNSCGHSLSRVGEHHHGWPVPGAASLWHTLLLRNVFHLKLTARQIWLQRKSSRVETERG